MRATNRLSVTAIPGLLKKPGRHADGLNLWLQVTKAKTASWLFRYMRDGVAREMGLGPLHAVPLKRAREKATAARELLADGIDPLEDRSRAKAASRLAAAKSMSFKEAAEAYIAAHEAGWRNPKHKEQWKNTLATFAYPLIGELPVADVDTDLVIKILEPIWRTKTETASRLRGRIESVLDWARVRGFRAGENPARWRGHLDHLLPAKSAVQTKSHHKALPFADVPTLMAELRARTETGSRALEFTILCATRTSETLGATWDEIDFGNKVWTIPASRMKAKREHTVALSRRAVEILRAQSGKGAFVFPGRKTDEPLSNMAMLEIMRDLRPDAGLTVHGFRSSFRVWGSEATSYPSELLEHALAHLVGDETQRAYDRTSMLERRRALMQSWSDHCEGLTGAKVVRLRRGKAA